MRRHGVAGASLSLDSTDHKRHDDFHHFPGAWESAVRAAGVLRDEGLDFSLHMSVADWNAEEIPAMIDRAGELGAKVLNFFFLVRTGRGERLTDLTPERYEKILTYLARTQGSGDLLIRAKCAPHFRRIIWELDPASPLLKNYAHGSCPAGKHYCRITPTGEVTPCPYMPVSAGSLRSASFADLWSGAAVFSDLRESKLKGRCGACEFRKICGGCRCRAYATYGDYLAEDPACGYQPGKYGGRLIDLPAEQTFGIDVTMEMTWEDAARERLDAIPSFARGMVVKGVEAYARSSGQRVITPELLREVREKWGSRFGRTG
jgi:radical SAM protein with 4Fe4S-binding SPASM domain